MSCYVCLEECNEKSPCECKHLVHEECLHQVCKSQHIIHCTICKSNIDGYVFKNSASSKNEDYTIIVSSDSDDSNDSNSDSDDNIYIDNQFYLEVSKCKYNMFYFFWWVGLSTVVSVLWSIIFCSSNVCNINGYETIFSLAFILEFIIIFGCSKKYARGEIRYSRS
jgi:hypothetical protein